MNHFSFELVIGAMFQGEGIEYNGEKGPQKDLVCDVVSGGIVQP